MELDIRHNLNESFASVDARLSQAESSLNDYASAVVSSEDSHTALRRALSLSYRIVEYRTMISQELSRLNSLELSNVTEASKAVIKKHISSLQARYSRVTDLRQDLELVQKLSYSNRINV